MVRLKVVRRQRMKQKKERVKMMQQLKIVMPKMGLRNRLVGKGIMIMIEKYSKKRRKMWMLWRYRRMNDSLV
ncbi:hypothetical protein GDO81_002083 [Engystomops pustulosus]|uniref:Uncharacterized protein n=1 Tax=Engystomops pustulosus TaxID=76066 RepID=A0AAV7DJL4_ENGPU|nr:hypothetical protein GDO81_002083 [Engystomops pustulosus]